jgi:acetyl-CoA carboxylase carboxyltransferase component
MNAGVREGPRWLKAPVGGAVAAVEVAAGVAVRAGQTLLVLEVMKLEVPVVAPADGVVAEWVVGLGQVVAEGAPLLCFVAQAADARARPADAEKAWQLAASSVASDALAARRALLADAARPEAIARRHGMGQRSARENVADLLDVGSFTEYGAFAIAAQRSRRPLEELQRQTPADGLITGTGLVGGAPVAVLAYDYTVLAGTQGVFNHAKADRLLELAARRRLPVVLFAEGGGGRPGDVDWLGVAGLDCTTFARLAALSGQVPLIGIVAGWCFAGNAALLGCCDLIVAVEGASIGLGGPAMIEGGGLGRVAPQDVGPLDVLGPAGVIDLRVADEAAAVRAAKQLLAMAARPITETAPAGGEAVSLRQALPALRRAVFDPRPILSTVFDAGSVIELRPEFGRAVVTALARLGGRAVAVAASAPLHGGGALDAPACDKLARFMQLADARGWPLVTLVDTPGFMVGPASEATAMVRHAARVFITAAALRVPVASVVLRRGYGLGAMALTAGHFHAPAATAAWPGGEFGAMGLEGAVRLGFRKELQAAPEAEREALFERLLADSLAKGQALNMASFLEIDDVIDPADTRDWLIRVLAAACAAPLPPRRAFIDPW